MGVAIQTVKKCGFLRQIAEGAKKGTNKLRECLLAAQSAVNSPSFQKGRIVISQSGSGQAGSFQIGTPGQEWTQDNILGLLEELIQLLDYTVAQGGTDGTDAATIDALFALMVDNLNTGNVPQIGITQQMGDFSGLNFPSTSLR